MIFFGFTYHVDPFYLYSQLIIFNVFCFYLWNHAIWPSFHKSIGKSLIWTKINWLNKAFFYLRTSWIFIGLISSKRWLLPLYSDINLLYNSDCNWSLFNWKAVFFVYDVIFQCSRIKHLSVWKQFSWFSFCAIIVILMLKDYFDVVELLIKENQHYKNVNEHALLCPLWQLFRK